MAKTTDDHELSNGHLSKNRIAALSVVLVSITLAFFYKGYPASYVVCSKNPGGVYTVDGRHPQVRCISVSGSRIVSVGSYEDTESTVWKTFATSFPAVPEWLLVQLKLLPRTIQLEEGAVIVPGLADAHAHVLENGYMNQLPLFGTHSIEDVVERVKEYIRSHPDVLKDKTKWIQGMGWDQTKWPEPNFPVAADLESDPLLKGRLISLHRVDGHASWTSPAVLALMQNLPDTVEGGSIIRGEDGKPTGVFVDNAMELVPLPPWSREEVQSFFDLTMREALSYGLTSIHDADVKLEHVDFYRRAAEHGTLPIRLYVMGRGPGEYWGGRLLPLKDHGKDKRLNFRSVKFMADGALGSWGAALLEPYSDKPDANGKLLASPETFKDLITKYWKDGWQTNIHCIGDRANDVILDIYEDVLERQGGNATEWRPRIEHAQIFTLADLERIGHLGVIASVQPTHATSDMGYAESRLGSQRIRGAYAYQTLLRVSPQQVLPLGSDFPVEGVNPLLGFYAAVARLSVAGTSPHGPGGWFPEEKLTREQALKGMTLDAAYASFSESDIGSLVSGKKADFVIFDRDIMTVPESEILQAKVVATVIDGKAAYGTL